MRVIPARYANVGYQSTIWQLTELEVPRRFAGMIPPEMNAAARKPPCEFAAAYELAVNTRQRGGR
jgi:hypothetical protein